MIWTGKLDEKLLGKGRPDQEEVETRTVSLPVWGFVLKIKEREGEDQGAQNTFRHK